jgi:molybdopterin-binding protein
VTALYDLRDVRVQRGERAVLDLPALELGAAGITALVGPNGAGKSTLLEVLAFLLPHAAGEMHFAQTPVTAASRPALSRRVGLVAQRPYLFDRSVRGNVILGLGLRGLTTAQAAARADDTLMRLGIAALAERHAGRLSGGEAQKVAIARTLALAPEVLLLDEPFSHLDAGAVDELVALIAALPGLGTRAVLFSTHDTDLALRLTSTVINLVDGRAGHGALPNFFDGLLDAASHVFDIGRLRVHVPDHVTGGTRIAIDPAHVVLSQARLESSMRNVFQGRVLSLAEHAGEVLVTVEVGPRLQALVTHEALSAQALRPGGEIWVSFKSNAVRVF